MAKVLVALFLFVSSCAAQSSLSGNFSVRHVKKADFSLASVQMHEAEKLYRSACAVVERDLHGSASHPRFTVILGASRDEVHGRNEIWLTKWDPVSFVAGVVILAVDHRLTADMVQQLTKRVVQYNNATVSVAELKERH
jgi:hypothetical protein